MQPVSDHYLREGNINSNNTAAVYAANYRVYELHLPCMMRCSPRLTITTHTKYIDPYSLLRVRVSCGVAD